ncbi:MAG TPA: 5-methyltetrahydropteroyltriglutamate--homocysteine methyltransferase, partial [Enterococcus aquimarinus]|nr:5-methyltetrahydropteroyltriglutamate--homocysteine methyltransferase [Enterococcus aquimarinus]
IRITKPLSGKNHHFITLFKQLKELAGDHPTKLTVWGAAHAFTELAIMNGIYGDDQVYHTQEELKEGLI